MGVLGLESEKRKLTMVGAGANHPVPVSQSPHLSLHGGVPQLLEITEAGCRLVGGLCCALPVGAPCPRLMEEVGTLAN